MLFRAIMVAFFILANSFFVAAEFALISVRVTRMEQLLALGRPGARTALHLKQNIDDFLPAVQFGVTLAALALGWLGVSLRHASQGSGLAQYHTLSADGPPVSGAHIRAVFAPIMTLADLSALLRAHHLLIVSGPTGAGAYTLASADPLTDAAQLSPVVAELRGDRRVLFAEPAVNDAAQQP